MTSESTRSQTAIVGVATTDYYKHGAATQSNERLACEAILAACADAGIDVTDIDGFSNYGDERPPSTIAPTLGIPELRYAAMVFGGGGGGSCAAVGNAVGAILTGQADVVCVYHAVKRTEATRFGGAGAATRMVHPWSTPYGLMTPAQQFALVVRRHMHLYGTTSEHLGHMAITQRDHALADPKSMMQSPLTLDDYFASRMIADPFRLFDCCLENDGASAMIITSADRARDLKQPPAYVLATAQGGAGSWGNALVDHAAPDDLYATAGHGHVARRLYTAAGVGPDDIEVAQLYDHFTGMVLLSLEDFGFCGKGEAGPFVAAGEARYDKGRIPVNTHGGNISGVNLHGMTHPIEGVRQMRGTSYNQVDGAELCLVTAGPSPLPTSAMILSKEPRS